MIDTEKIHRQLEARGPMPCARCKDAGTVAVRGGVSYETDTADERADCWHYEPCPLCGGIAKRAVGLLAETLTELANTQESYRTLEPCGHTKNFLIGDEHGHFSCTVCALKVAEEDSRMLDWAEVNLDDVTVIRDLSAGTRWEITYCASESSCQIESKAKTLRETILAAMGKEQKP